MCGESIVSGEPDVAVNADLVVNPPGSPAPFTTGEPTDPGLES